METFVLIIIIFSSIASPFFVDIYLPSTVFPCINVQHPNTRTAISLNASTSLDVTLIPFMVFLPRIRNMSTDKTLHVIICNNRNGKTQAHLTSALQNLAM
eukprot:285746_1